MAATDAGVVFGQLSAAGRKDGDVANIQAVQVYGLMGYLTIG